MRIISILIISNFLAFSVKAQTCRDILLNGPSYISSIKETKSVRDASSNSRVILNIIRAMYPRKPQFSDLDARFNNRPNLYDKRTNSYLILSRVLNQRLSRPDPMNSFRSLPLSNTNPEAASILLLGSILYDLDLLELSKIHREIVFRDNLGSAYLTLAIATSSYSQEEVLGMYSRASHYGANGALITLAAVRSGKSIEYINSNYMPMIFQKDRTPLLLIALFKPEKI